MKKMIGKGLSIVVSLGMLFTMTFTLGPAISGEESQTTRERTETVTEQTIGTGSNKEGHQEGESVVQTAEETTLQEIPDVTSTGKITYNITNDGNDYTITLTSSDNAVPINDNENHNYPFSEFLSNKVNDIVNKNKDAKVHVKVSGITFPSDSSYLFSYMKMTTIGFENCITSSVTDMSKMFEDCENLETADLSCFDTENVTSMEAMFNTNVKLKEVKMSENFKTSKVTNMENMFLSCKSLESLGVSHFDLSSIVNMSSMFTSACIDALINTKLIGLHIRQLQTISANYNTKNNMILSNVFLDAFFTKEPAVLDLSTWTFDTKNMPEIDVAHRIFDFRKIENEGQPSPLEPKVILAKKFYSDFSNGVKKVRGDAFGNFGQFMLPSEGNTKNFNGKGTEPVHKVESHEGPITHSGFENSDYIMISNRPDVHYTDPDSAPPTNNDVKEPVSIDSSYSYTGYTKSNFTVTFTLKVDGEDIYQTLPVDSTFHIDPSQVITPVREGYEFLGWYISKHDAYKTAPRTTEDDLIPFDLHSRIFADLTVYAKWKKVPQEQPKKAVPNTADC